MFDSSNCNSDNVIESELKPYINVLAEPYFYEPLLKLAKNISQKEALVYLDLVDVISTLSISGKSWVEEINWDSSKKQSNISQVISAIESKKLKVNSAKKTLIWINAGFEVPVSEISLLQDQITSIGNENTEYSCGICIDENNADLFECMILVGGLVLTEPKKELNMKIKTVAIVGGTHGNEYTGPYLLKLLEGSEVIDKYSSLDIKLILSNPKAISLHTSLI